MHMSATRCYAYIKENKLLNYYKQLAVQYARPLSINSNNTYNIFKAKCLE